MRQQDTDQPSVKTPRVTTTATIFLRSHLAKKAYQQRCHTSRWQQRYPFHGANVLKTRKFQHQSTPPNTGQTFPSSVYTCWIPGTCSRQSRRRLVGLLWASAAGWCVHIAPCQIPICSANHTGCGLWRGGWYSAGPILLALIAPPAALWRGRWLRGVYCCCCWYLF